MSIIGRFINKLRRKKIEINTPWGLVTESARKQAALNMRDDPEKRAQVEAMLVSQFGSVAAGMAEFRRRYPEAIE